MCDLAEYYQNLGKHDPIHINLPRGTYVPVFSLNGEEPPLAEAESDAELVPDAARIDEGIVRPRNKVWRRWLAAAAALVLAAAVVGYFFSHRTPRFTDKDSIVLADFDNNAGDAVFDDALKQGLAIQMEQSPFLYLVPDSKVNATLRLMGRPAGARLTPEVTREVCLRTSSTAMLNGSIARLGSQYVIGLQVVDCNNGYMLAEAQEQAANKEAVLNALDAAAIDLRGKLGESLSSVEKYSTPLAQATTPSLEALKAYSLGQKTSSAEGGTAALPFYQRAVELDPSFATAYIAMSAVYGNLNEAGRMVENASKAYELRDRVSERERVTIEASYYTYATGELEKAAQAWERWQRTYPRDVATYANLGFIYFSLGSYEKALQEDREAMRRDPNSWVSYANLAAAYANLNRLDESDTVLKQAHDRKLESEGLLANDYALAFLKGDTAGMGRVAAAAVGKPGTEDFLLAYQADTEAWHGRFKNAHELTQRAMDSAEHNGAKETAATYQAAAALRETASGNGKQARVDADAAVKLAPNRDVRAMAALALAQADDRERAEKLEAELDKTFPLDTMVQRYWLPSIRAAVALERNDPNQAVELLKAANTIELGQPTEVSVFLCPVYLRGEAYLMLHKSNAAAAEFQKFIDHWGVVWNFPWAALARLGVARAYALNAATDPAARAKARVAYQNFLTLWKDAELDNPLYIRAKAEYATLK